MNFSITHRLVRRKFQLFFPTIQVEIKDKVVFLDGELSSWDDIVRAGYLATKFKLEGVVNRIHLQGYTAPKMRTSSIQDSLYEGLKCDVLVIGGGIVGCSILRELSKYQLSAVLIEKENDVALHASSRNDGCIHIGLDLSPKTKKHYYLREAHKIYKDLARDLQADYIQNGQTLVFTKSGERLLVPLFKSLAKKRNIVGTTFLSKTELRKKEPNITKDAKFALFFPEGANICPYGMTIALAENAIENGAQVLLNTAALSMKVYEGHISSVTTNRGTIYPKVVINAAGTFADQIAAMAGDQFYTIHPRKGIEFILDKKARPFSINASTSIYQGSKEKKREHTKGGGIIPTVDGNVLVGPTAQETPDREDYTTDAGAIDKLLAKHRRTTPSLKGSDVITYFAGIRASTYEEDFVVRPGKWVNNMVHAAGIQSPGLTAAPAIAQDIVKMTMHILDKGIVLKSDFKKDRKAIVVTKALPDLARNGVISRNNNYGIIVCRCEEVSKGEIIDALRRPLAVDTVDAIKRRVRAGMGRCQGGFCQQQIVQIIAAEKKIKLEEVHKKGEGVILFKDTKEGQNESV